jgi:hypothetical protein
MHFLVTFKKNLPLKSYKIALTTLWKKFRWITQIFFIWLKFWFQKKFEKEIVFGSSVLAWIRIRNEQKCWIRIRINSIRIHNPAWMIPVHKSIGKSSAATYRCPVNMANISMFAWIKDPVKLAHTLHYPGLLLWHKHDGCVEGCGLLPAGRDPPRHGQWCWKLVRSQHATAHLVKRYKLLINIPLIFSLYSQKTSINSYLIIYSLDTVPVQDTGTEQLYRYILRSVPELSYRYGISKLHKLVSDSYYYR